MPCRPEDTLPLTDRVPSDVLFACAAGRVTASAFLADVWRAAAVLPAGRHMVNVCASRYWFAVGFAACLVRGQISLLTGDHSARGLAQLERRFAETWALTDDPALQCPLRHAVIGPDLPHVTTETMPRIEAGMVAVTVFSSGSTGEPVGTAKTFGELVWRSRAAASRFAFGANAPATIVGTVPPHHMYGFETTVLLPLHAAVSSWCDPVFYPPDLRAPLASCAGRAVLVTTPLQLRAMLAMKGAVRSPDMVISATAPLDSALAGETESLWGAEVHEIFGATEVGSIASRRTVRDADWSLYPGVTLADENRPMVFAEGAAPRALNDVVRIAADGRHFSLLGRCGDIVKLGGRRASLAGLSRALTELDGVSDGVFVAPDDIETRPTARLMALVVSPALSNDQVLGGLRARIDPVFLPRPLVRVPALPRNGLGKLPRQALLALLAEHAPGPAHGLPA